MKAKNSAKSGIVSLLERFYILNFCEKYLSSKMAGVSTSYQN